MLLQVALLSVLLTYLACSWKAAVSAHAQSSHTRALKGGHAPAAAPLVGTIAHLSPSQSHRSKAIGYSIAQNYQNASSCYQLRLCFFGRYISIYMYIERNSEVRVLIVGLP